MLATDEDAVICDFAETYHVLDYRALDLPLAATLAAGLAPDSRSMRKLSGAKAPTELLLLASIADSAAFVAWAQTEDAAKNKNRPKSLVQALTGEASEPEAKQIKTFRSGEAFLDAWNERK